MRALVLVLLLACPAIAGVADDFVEGAGVYEPPPTEACRQRIQRDPLYGNLSYGRCGKPAAEPTAKPSRGHFTRGKLPRKGSLLDRYRGVPFTNPENR